MRRPALLPALCALGLIVAAGPVRAQSSSSSNQTALNTEMRMSALEDQMRDLTGRVEELTNNLAQLKQQLDRLSSDLDVRFSQLRSPAAGPGAPPAPGPEVPRASANPAPSPAPAGQQTASAAANMSAGSAQDQYNYALGLMQEANYPAAEQAMRAIVQHWPNDPLAGNAQYWLGETYYARKDYTNAATAFAQGYEKYPKSSKAPDDLLKLGMSLTNLNQKVDACRAFGRLQRDFPNASQSIKERLSAERQRAGC